MFVSNSSYHSEAQFIPFLGRWTQSTSDRFTAYLRLVPLPWFQR